PDLPHARRSILGGAHEHASARIEAYAAHRAAVAAQDLQGTAGASVPDSHGAVAAGTGDARAIGGECCRTHFARRPDEIEQRLRRLRVPHPHAAPAGDEHTAFIGREACRPYPAIAQAQGRQRVTAWDFPEPRGAVPTRGYKLRAVGRKSRADDGRAMTAQL